MTPSRWSVALQALGSAATLGAAALVAWRFGLAAQGEFGLLRTWADALTAGLVLGLPQGLLHLQYREQCPAAVLLVWIGRYLFVLTLAMAATAGLLLWAVPLPWFATRVQAAIVVMVVPFAVAHLLWRAIVLKARGLVPYAAVTSLPALLMLAGIAGFCAVGQGRGFEWVLLASAALAAGASGWLVRAAARPGGPSVALPIRSLWSISLQTWVQGLMAALLPALLLSVAGWRGAALADIGVVSLGLQVYLLFGVLAAYVAPILYDRVARMGEPVHAGASLAAWRARIGAPVLIAGAATALLGPWLIARLAPALAPYVFPTTVLALAGMVSLAVRLLWTLLQARGQVREITFQSVARLALACALSVVLLPRWGAPLSIALVLLAVEALTLARLATCLHEP